MPCPLHSVTIRSSSGPRVHTAEGVSLVNTIRDDESGTITFVLARLEGYAWKDRKGIVLGTDDAELPMAGPQSMPA